MNGVIVIDKPKGKTSHDIVQKVKRITGEKIGHTGTLDPLATGVLPILIGTATKISKYLVEHDKTYEVVLQLGEKTISGDAEGEIAETREVPILELKNIQNVMQKMIGKQKQTPPIYSAIKVKGKKLYEYARKGETVEIPVREIEIYSINLQSYLPEEKQIMFTVSCSKGTYIRSFCETIAETLGTVGYMKELRRTQVGRFTLKQALKVEELEYIESLEEKIFTIETLFENYPSYILPEKKKDAFYNGVQIAANQQDGVSRVYEEDGKFIGLGIVKNQKIKRDVLL